MKRLAAICCCCATIFSFPLHAQEPAPPELEALIAPSLDPATGIAFARTQIGDNDLLGAAGTLERVMIVNHDAHDARLLYASVLCRLDDAAGARVELSLLRGQDVTDPAWAEVTAACGALPRPQIQPEGGQ